MGNKYSAGIIKATLLGLIVLMIMIVSAIDVNANTKGSAESISLNTTKSHKFRTEDDSEHFYKFVAPKTGYYEITVTDYLKKHSYVKIISSKGKTMAYGSVDSNAGKIYCATRFKAGKTYYIEVDVYITKMNSSKTVKTKVAKHSHKYVVTAYYENVDQKECTTPECGYRKFVFHKSPEILKIHPKEKAFQVKWSAPFAVQDGYKIQYSTSSKFPSDKTKSVYTTATSLKTVNNLKAGKKYYVRIRPYIKVKLYNENRTYKCYGPWSNVKTVKTK